MAYPYKYLTLCNFQQRLNLQKENLWLTLKQSYPSDEEINCTLENIEKIKIKNGQELTMFYLQMDVLQLADVFENFIEKSTLMYGITPLCSYSAPGFTWKAGLKIPKITLVFIKDKHLLLLLENNIRWGISSV